MNEALLWLAVIFAVLLAAPVLLHLVRRLDYERQVRSGTTRTPARPERNVPPDRAFGPEVQLELDKIRADTRVNRWNGMGSLR